MSYPVRAPRNRTEPEPPPLTEADIARFHGLVKAYRDGAGEDDCWRWPIFAGCDYPRFQYRKRYVYAHRLAYWLAKGTWPAHRAVMHSCDTPGCVNPGHLSAGTWSENAADCDAKGRRRKGVEVTRAKLTDALVFRARLRFRDGEKLRDIAADLGVGHCTVRDAVHGRTWSHVAWPRDLEPRVPKASIEIRQRLGLPYEHLAEESSRVVSVREERSVAS